MSVTNKGTKSWHNGLSDLKDARRRYLDSLAAIQELVYFATEHVTELDAKRVILGASFSRKPPGLAFLRSYAETLVRIADESAPDRKINIMQVLQEHLEDYKQALSKEDAEALDSLVVLERSRGRASLLLASLLITAVSDFEVLISSVISCFYRMRPEALRAQDSKISWSEVEAHESLDDLKSHFIDERVSQLMWEGFDGWLRWLSSQLKIKYEDATLDSEGTAEIFQRRHVIVHNGGFVSPQYLTKGRKTTGITVGSPLPVDLKYLEASLDRLSVLGISILHLMLRKLCSKETDHKSLDSDISRLASSLLRQQKWEITQAICSIALPEVKHEYERCSIRVSKWVAQKHLKGKAAIIHEVSAWDTSALQPIFKLAQQALIEDPSMIDFGRNLAASSEFDRTAINTWPAFDNIREQITGSTQSVEDA